MKYRCSSQLECLDTLCVTIIDGLCMARTVSTSALLQVGPRLLWKSPDHPLRKDSVLQLKGIPTLIHWQDNGQGRRLGKELEEAQTEDEADRLVADFAAACFA